MYAYGHVLEKRSENYDTYMPEKNDMHVPCRRNRVLTDLLVFAIDFWMLPRYIPEHFGILSEV